MKKEKQKENILEEYKKMRDSWLEFMVYFKEQGDVEKANMCLENASKIWALRTEIEPIILDILTP